MLRANQAVRLGLRASSRNPELAFGRALIDQFGSLLAVLPVLLAALFVTAIADRESLLGALRSIRALTWPTAGGIVTAAALAFSAGMLFWAGALPVIAADEEMDRRPPPGNFAVLASRGFARVLTAGLVAAGLPILFTAACAIAVFAAVPAMLVRPSAGLLAGAALIASLAILGAALLDILGRLTLVRAAAFGETVSVAFGRAGSLMLARLGACLIITVAFLVLDLIVATTAGMLTGMVSGDLLFDPDTALLALAPRFAIGLATAVVLAWLEVGRMGALAALALDAEGLIESAAGPVTPPPVPLAEPVIEAIPVDEE